MRHDAKWFNKTKINHIGHSRELHKSYKQCFPKNACHLKVIVDISIVDFMLQTMKVFIFAWLLKNLGSFPYLLRTVPKPLILSNYTAWNELKFISVQLYACWINTEWSSPSILILL